ncbi:nuclear transport factor 2 family protein [Herbiconiux sp. P17]|uniref:nuclear transport factor 2 family protein n=1 Tax=Herbiconiux wuyangfengii TaxID=3342794 RepID=UPI0035B7940C
MATAAELLAANLHQVFGNRDAASRREAIDATYTDDVAFTDPEGTETGRDALEKKAASLIDTAPADFVFEEQGLAYTSADSGALAWTFGPSGAPVARGIDLITIRDGKISALSTLLHE